MNLGRRRSRDCCNILDCFDDYSGSIKEIFPDFLQIPKKFKSININF